MSLKQAMGEQIVIARSGDRDRCTERYAVETRQVEGLRSEGRAGKHQIVIDEPTGFDAIDAEVRIDSPASAADIARLINRVERCCPVLDTIRNATPIRLQRA